MRLLLVVPPVLALTLAVAAMAASVPRPVLMVRGWSSQPPDDPQSWPIRVFVSRITPLEPAAGPSAASALQLRVLPANSELAPTDEWGVSELVLRPPYPTRLQFFIHEARPDGARPRDAIADVVLHTTTPSPPAAESDDGPRLGTSGTDSLWVDAAVELGALVPPHASRLWVLVHERRASGPGTLASATRVEADVEAGLEPIAPSTTDEHGLAQLVVTPIAPPALVTLRASRGVESGRLRLMLPVVFGVPRPTQAILKNHAITLLPASSRRQGWVDVFQRGTRRGGGSVHFDAQSAEWPLPPDLDGALTVETRDSPWPDSDDEHTGRFILFRASSEHPRPSMFAIAAESATTPLPSLGAEASREESAEAQLAFARARRPHWTKLFDSTEAAIEHELERSRRTRRLAGLAVVGGVLCELGLMMACGVFRPVPIAIAEEGSDEASAPRRRSSSRRLPALLMSTLGLVTLVFVGIGFLVWGNP